MPRSGWRAPTSALGRPDEAVALYDRLVQASLTSSFVLDPIVILAATDLDLAAGRIDKARARIARLPAGARRSPEALVATGATAQRAGDEAAAERAYRSALQASPSDFEALQRLMDLLLSQKRAADAAGVAAASAKSFPASPQHLSLAGEAALAAKRYPEAETFFARAAALAPDADAIRLDLARAQLLAGRAEAALETLQNAAATRDAEMLRGAAHSARHDAAAAVAAFDRALAIGPPSPDLLNALAAAADRRRPQGGRGAVAPTLPRARSESTVGARAVGTREESMTRKREGKAGPRSRGYGRSAEARSHEAGSSGPRLRGPCRQSWSFAPRRTWSRGSRRSR